MYTIVYACTMCSTHSLHWIVSHASPVHFSINSILNLLSAAVLVILLDLYACKFSFFPDFYFLFAYCVHIRLSNSIPTLCFAVSNHILRSFFSNFFACFSLLIHNILFIPLFFGAQHKTDECCNTLMI